MTAAMTLAGPDGVRELSEDEYRTVVAYLEENQRTAERRFTTGQIAKILNVSRSTVVRMMDDGILPYSRPNPRGHRVVTERQLRQFERQQQQLTHQLREDLYDAASQDGLLDMTAEEPENLESLA